LNGTTNSCRRATDVLFRVHVNAVEIVSTAVTYPLKDINPVWVFQNTIQVFFWWLMERNDTISASKTKVPYRHLVGRFGTIECSMSTSEDLVLARRNSRDHHLLMKVVGTEMRAYAKELRT
jgi:hypothetical protein